MLNLKKMLASAGINLEEMQKDAKQVPALLEALVKQNNAQVKAIKNMQTELTEARNATYIMKDVLDNLFRVNTENHTEIIKGQATNESKLDLIFKKLDSISKSLSS